MPLHSLTAMAETSVIARAIEGTWAPIERRLLSVLDVQSRHPPLFVVGPPRCGTTIVYQYLVRVFEAAYVPNLSEDHPDAPVSFAWWARQVGDDVSSYENRFGHVPGRAAPSDGWHLFNRWFPTYDLDESIDPAYLRDLPRLIGGFERVFGGPFFNKNNHNSVRLDYLDRACPRARFLHVTRHHGDATLSLLEARRTHEVGAGEWWSCPPPHFYDQLLDSELERAAYTIVDVDRTIERTLVSLEPERHHRVSYESFCSQPRELAKWVRATYQKAGVQLEPRISSLSPDLEARTRPEARSEAIQGVLSRAREASARAVG